MCMLRRTSRSTGPRVPTFLRSLFFFFNDTATTEIYTFPYTTLFRSSARRHGRVEPIPELQDRQARRGAARSQRAGAARSEEHTSELQSRLHLVCRLLLEKKKTARQPAELQSPLRLIYPRQRDR